MPKKVFLILSFALLAGAIAFTINQPGREITGAPPYGESEEDVSQANKLNWLTDWKRPSGPPKVGLQVGHWKNEELPEELDHLKTSTGSSGGGKDEWEVNLAVAQQTAKILEENGIQVDILPAVVPKNYWADAFVAIHADGSTDYSTSGFKVAAPWMDLTRDADELSEIIQQAYQKETGLSIDENITRNMRGYYAFSWWRHEHSVHPMTTSVILETGFLTNYSDRQMLINNPQTPAKGLANGIIKHLQKEGIIAS